MLCQAHLGHRPSAQCRSLCDRHAIECVRSLGLAIASPSAGDQYHTLAEVAAMTGMSRDYWLTRVTEKEIRAVNFGSAGHGADWRISLAALRAFCAGKQSLRTALKDKAQVAPTPLVYSAAGELVAHETALAG